jgi:hypothetical protein
MKLPSCSISCIQLPVCIIPITASLLYLHRLVIVILSVSNLWIISTSSDYIYLKNSDINPNFCQDFNCRFVNRICRYASNLSHFKFHTYSYDGSLLLSDWEVNIYLLFELNKRNCSKNVLQICCLSSASISIQFNLFHPRIILHDMGQVKD